MSYRQFTDSKRVTWEVWEVEPSRAERRIASRDRRGSPRPGADRRRVAQETRVRISTELRLGWLVFESRHDKRRLAPIPEGWDSLDDAALERLCARARSVGRPRRLIE